jgi:hypothetical protein
MLIRFIVTYADNNKFDDFFRKQGFGDSEIHPFLDSNYINS